MSNESMTAGQPSENETQPSPDWLEPPAWWQKWRPLRWLAAIAVLIGLYVWLAPMLRPAPRDVAELPVVESARATAEPRAEAAMTAVPAVTPERVEPAAELSAGAEAETETIDESIFFEEADDTPVAAESDIAAFTDVVPDPVPLLGGIYRSYMGVDGIVQALEVSGLDPIVESRHARVAEGVPPRDLDVVTVAAYRHWGVSGRMELQFFNDRLYQVEFEPQDAETYRSAQRRELPQLKRERAGRSELIDGHLRVASSLDLSVSDVGQKLQTRPFLLWQDRRLVRLRDEWDRRFGVVTAP